MEREFIQNGEWRYADIFPRLGVVLSDGGLDVNYIDSRGLSLCQYAARHGHIQVLEKLAAKNANFLVKTKVLVLALFHSILLFFGPGSICPLPPLSGTNNSTPCHSSQL
jgi:hypothetical protein